MAIETSKGRVIELLDDARSDIVQFKQQIAAIREALKELAERIRTTKGWTFIRKTRHTFEPTAQLQTYQLATGVELFRVRAQYKPASGAPSRMTEDVYQRTPDGLGWEWRHSGNNPGPGGLYPVAGAANPQIGYTSNDGGKIWVEVEEFGALVTSW